VFPEIFPTLLSYIIIFSALPAAPGTAVHSFAPEENYTAVTVKGCRDSVKGKEKFPAVGVEYCH
jgi:hypothetical protein